MLATLATVVIPCDYRFASYHASWEVTATTTTDRIVFADRILAVSTRTLDLLPWSLLWRVLGEDADSDVGIPLSLLGGSHSLQLDKRTRTLLITLHIEGNTLL